MVGIQQSIQQQTLTFSAAPADVAAALEAAVSTVGQVTNADPSTGRIEGKLRGGLKGWEESARIEILVSKAGEQTQVQVQTTHPEGAISMHGAEKTMNAFLDAVRAQPTLAGTSTAGW